MYPLLAALALAGDRALISLSTAEEFAAAPAREAVGLRVQMELERGGKTRAVPLDTPLYNGDGVALRFTPSADGYAYVLNRGTSGRYTLIYPDPLAEAPRLPSGAAARVPASGTFPVSGDPGDEGIAILLSPSPVGPEVVDALRRLVDGDGGAVAFRALVSLSTAEAYVVSEPREDLRVTFTLSHLAGSPP